MTASSASGWHSKFEEFLKGEEPNAAGEIRGFCPLHEDPETSKSPSATFNFEKGLFHCNGCGQGLTLGQLWQIVKEDRADEARASAPSSSRSGRGRVRSIDDAPSKRSSKLPTDAEVLEFHEALLASPEHLRVMKEKRGLSLDTLRRFQLGWHRERYTIPIRDGDGAIVNVRRYKADAKLPKDKMVSWAVGLGERRLFLPDVLADHDEVILTEGELDAIIGQQYGFQTMSHTAGASAWNNAWNPNFEGKTIFICYDVDDIGKQGARKVAMQLSKVARQVFVVVLPGVQRGFDLTNYFVDQGYSAKDFKSLLDQHRKNPFGRQRESLAGSGKPPKAVSLEASQDSDHGGAPLEVVATIAGKIQPAYMLPRRVEFTCSMDWGDKCNVCPMQARGGSHIKRVERDDPFLLELLDRSKEQVEKSLKRLAEAPTTCPKLEPEQVEQWNVEELVALPAVDEVGEEAQTPISRRVYNVGPYGTPINTKVRLVGVNTADPRSQRGVLQTWECEAVQTDIDKFVMTDAMYEELQVFWPDESQAPMDKLKEIASDLEANVTRIYGRPALHVAYDLVWHSVMDFRFGNRALGKGWIELLVMGDTRTGKSEAAEKLMRHYRSGVLKSCEGATLAGLVGGAQQVGNSWMVMWGTIPLNDRRLVVLDELSGIKDKDIIEQMSSVRSSGKAQITKIVSQETSARTRLIWISNPPDGRAIEEMPSGATEAIQDLVKNPEDIARFDLAMSAARGDVDSTLINAREHPYIPHVYTTELCSSLVAWAWSRKLDQVIWQSGTEDFLLERAELVGHRYIPDPPLVQAENIRVKLARIAVAIAARLFSCDDTGEKIVVSKAHVEAAEQIIDKLYGMTSFGYRNRSRKVLKDRELAEANRRKARRWLTTHQYDAYVALQAVVGSPFKVRDFCEFAGMSQDEAQTSVRELMEMRMVRRLAKGYIKMDPALVTLLKDLEANLEDE